MGHARQAMQGNVDAIVGDVLDAGEIQRDVGIPPDDQRRRFDRREPPPAIGDRRTRRMGAFRITRPSSGRIRRAAKNQASKPPQSWAIKSVERAPDASIMAAISFNSVSTVWSAHASGGWCGHSRAGSAPKNDSPMQPEPAIVRASTSHGMESHAGTGRADRPRRIPALQPTARWPIPRVR